MKTSHAACCMWSAWIYTLYTLVHTQYVQRWILFFFHGFRFLSLQRQTAEDRAEISGHHLKCMYLFNLPFLLSDAVTCNLVAQLPASAVCSSRDLSFTSCLAATPRKYLKTQQTLDYIWIILPASHSPTLPFIFESCNQRTLWTFPAKPSLVNSPTPKFKKQLNTLTALSCGRRGQPSEARAEFLWPVSALNHSSFFPRSAFSIISVSDWWLLCLAETLIWHLLLHLSCTDRLKNAQTHRHTLCYFV